MSNGRGKLTCHRSMCLLLSPLSLSSLGSYDFIFLDFSPQRVVFSGWVGDEDPTFDGLVQALKRYLQSTWAGNGMWER